MGTLVLPWYRQDGITDINEGIVYGLSVVVPGGRSAQIEGLCGGLGKTEHSAESYKVRDSHWPHDFLVNKHFQVFF